MRQFVLLAATILLLGIGTCAQGTPQTSSLFISPFEDASAPAGASLPVAKQFSLAPSSSFSKMSFDTTPFNSTSFNATTVGASLESSSLAADPDKGSAEPTPPQVFGVKPTYDFQAYVGYTFIRLYEVPSITTNTNGFNYSIVYFPQQLKGIIGADGEFVLTLGDQNPYQARFLLGMGGARVRWAPFSRNIEIWGHGLFGGTHLVPQTPFGVQHAFAYEIGGGIDINTRRERYAFRVGADMIGTHYFGTYQFSPKISTGFIYRF
jgi:hypothetical protein